jgi:hypothetical protein
MNQDPINSNYNPQNTPNQYNPFNNASDGQNNDGNNFQPTPVQPIPLHFSPSSVDLDALSAKSQLDNLMHQPHTQGQNNNFEQQGFNSTQPYQQNEQFGSYNPYQNTGSNIQNFAPQDNFDTGFNQDFNSNPEFNQNGIDQYKSVTPQFNPNDPYLMPSTNPELDDIEDPEEQTIEKPQKDTKKILMFGLIGLIVVLLVASLALFFLTQSKNTTPSVNINTTSSKSTSLTTSDKSEITKAVDSTLETGGADTPAGKSIINPGATTIPEEWLSKNFTGNKGALSSDGTCKLQAICGPKSDPDKDGLSNIKEYIYGTVPTVNDTDKDGLSDKDELFVYHTNPKSTDSNANSYTDSVEITNCYDPNISSQKFTKTRLNEISSSINKPFVNGLSEPTITTLKEGGAKAGELEKGYMSKCAVTTASDTVTNDNSIRTPLPQETNTNEGS